MNQYFKILEERDEVMGSLSILKGDEEVYTNSIGYQDISKQLDSSSKTQYAIGSISKMYVSTLILSFIDQGLISLENKVSQYFPNIPRSTDITIEHLLRHRSGLSNITEADGYDFWSKMPHTNEKLLERLKKLDLNFVPGDKFEYSNSNYSLLALIAQQIKSQSFNQLLQESICQPCSLPNTIAIDTYISHVTKTRSYAKLAEWKQLGDTHGSVLFGAGNIVSTASDVNRYLKCLFDGKLISEQLLLQMTETSNEYGMGVITAPFYERHAFGHGGRIDGYQSHAFYYPDEDVAFTFLTNACSPALNDIMIGTLSIYFNKDFDLPSSSKPIKVKVEADKLQSYVGTYQSSSLPIKLNITILNGQLYGQATGQRSFPLTAYNDDTFRFDPSGIKITFDSSLQSLILHQRGGKYKMSK